MPQPPSAYDAHQQQRWTRHDAHLWVRHDAARFLPPGMDPADLYPTLARKPDAANAAAFEAEVAKGYRLLAVLRAEVDELRAELKRRRELEAKYSPTQPRVPVGDPRGGQWTDRGGGQGTVASPSQDTGQSPDANLTLPMGDVDVGNLTESSELTGLFNIAPSDSSRDGLDLAANFNQVGSDGKPVLDVDGSPYYAPGGHHAAPGGVYSKMNFPPETRKIFDQSTSGELPKGRALVDDSGIPKGHYWDGPGGRHRQYNDAVKELMENFMRGRNITPETTAPDHARDILKAIRESEDPRIRDYTRMIRILRQMFRLRGGRE